jgi:hypothetical protein
MQRNIRLIRAGMFGLVTVLAAAGCGRAAGPAVTMHVTGDSIVAMVERPVEDGTVMAECAAEFRGTVEGPEGEYALVRGGRVVYHWWQTGDEASTYEWTPEAAGRLWQDSVFPAGHLRISRRHGFAQGTPAQPVRAEVVFDYASSTDPEVRQTEPYRFYCY